MPTMRRQLMTSLARLREASLDARAAISPRSPVSILDALLTARAKSLGAADKDRLPDFSREPL
jgi:hypothetical protein